jgi:3-dehydroquinate dehydratase II
MKKIIVIHGPNLNLLGKREPDTYGGVTFDELNNMLRKAALKAGVELGIAQSNHEGEIVDIIQKAGENFEAIIINPGAYTHTSIAIRDAIAAVGLPTVEVHISNIYKREDFRHKSYISEVAAGVISGFGINSYMLGIRAALAILKTGKNANG